MSLTRANLLWLLGYLAAMTAVVVGLAVARGRVVATLSTPEARQQWRAWKEQAARRKTAAGPIERRPIASDEPPALVLLRDHFPAIVVSTFLIVSFLFAFLAFAARGAFRDGRSAP